MSVETKREIPNDVELSVFADLYSRLMPDIIIKATNSVIIDHKKCVVGDGNILVGDHMVCIGNNCQMWGASPTMFGFNNIHASGDKEEYPKHKQHDNQSRKTNPPRLFPVHSSASLFSGSSTSQEPTTPLISVDLTSPFGSNRVPLPNTTTTAQSQITFPSLNVPLPPRNFVFHGDPDSDSSRSDDVDPLARLDYQSMYPSQVRDPPYVSRRGGPRRNSNSPWSPPKTPRKNKKMKGSNVSDETEVPRFPSGEDTFKEGAPICTLCETNSIALTAMCGHCTCFSCAGKLTSGNGISQKNPTCPTCRTPIDRMIRLYLP
jgi:hypothetical protein